MAKTFTDSVTALIVLIVLLLCHLSCVCMHPDDCDYSEDFRFRNGEKCHNGACKHLICKELGYKVQASYCDRGHDAYLCCCNYCNLKLQFPNGDCGINDAGKVDCSNHDFSLEDSYCLEEKIGCCLRDDSPQAISDDDDDDNDSLPDLIIDANTPTDDDDEDDDDLLDQSNDEP